MVNYKNYKKEQASSPTTCCSAFIHTYSRSSAFSNNRFSKDADGSSVQKHIRFFDTVVILEAFIITFSII